MNKREKLLAQKTLTEFFLTSASLRYGKPAYILKDEKGNFRTPVTYAELMERSYQFASALIAEDFSPGDITAMMSNSRIEFSIADIGTTMLGGITAGIYVTDSSEMLEYKLNHLETRILVIENALIHGVPQLDKVLRIPRSSLPRLEKIVVIGGFDPADDNRLVAFDEFSRNTKHLPAVSEKIYLLEPEMPAVIVYSSGTEGHPKGSILTHHNIMSCIRQADSRMKMTESKRYMDFLPPAHVFGYMVRRSIEGLGAAIYPSHRDTLAQDLPAVAPHIIAGVPKFYMALADRIRTRVTQLSIDINNLTDTQKQLILRAAGLSDVELALSGAAAIPDETVLFFRDKLGFRIDQAYGVTETSPGITVNTKDEWKLGSAGKPFDGVDVAIFDPGLNGLPIGAEGEIAVSGDNVFAGYFKDDERTAQVLKKKEGKTWYLTGDIGFFDGEGFLHITDRKDDMLVPTSGENVSSASIENQIAMHSRYIGYAVPYGAGRPHITAVLWSDETRHEKILEDARAAGIEADDAAAALARPEFRQLLESDIRRALEQGGFSSHERPKGFIFITNPGEDEVTGTLKARKRSVRTKYAPQLDELYKSGEFLKIITQ